MAIALVLASALVLATGVSLWAQEPCSGEPIEVLNKDICELSKWIAVEDSATVCQIRCLMEFDYEKCGFGIFPGWIGGTVIADENAEYGFYFDPKTVWIAEITIEVIQTTTCQIRDNPKYYDGGTWCIPFSPSEIR